MNVTRPLTIPAASRALGLTEYLVRAMVARKEIASLAVNGRRMILPEAIQALRARAMRNAPGEADHA